jgi:diguanylate cyclase (GGDEF)-like protein
MILGDLIERGTRASERPREGRSPVVASKRPRTALWRRTPVVASVGVALSLAGAAAPVLWRDRAGSANVRRTTTELARTIEQAFTGQIATMRSLAKAVPDLVPDPERINRRLAKISIPAKQAFFDDALVIASLGRDPEPGLDLAIVVGRDSDGKGLRFTGLSSGTRVTDLLAVAKIPTIPAANASARLLRVPGSALATEVVGPMNAGRVNTVIAETVPVLAVPVPNRGWILSVARPAGVDVAADRLRYGATLAVSLHAGRGAAGALLAERRALTPPPAGNLRGRAQTFTAVDQPVTVIVSADRYLGAPAGLPPLAVLLAGLVATTAAGATASVRNQRRTRVAMEAELDRERTLARTDSLTNLGNRLAFTESIDAALDADHPVAVLMCDLDRFKVVNDARGHDVGDQLLADVAGRLRHAVSGLDAESDPGTTARVYRFGGDEFVLALTGRAADEAVEVAHGLVSSIRMPFRVGVDQVVIGVSIGLATSTMAETPPTRSSLLSDADMAMYVAKRGGGNRVAVADEAVRRSTTSQLDLEIELRKALGSGHLRAWYQPLINRNRDVVALEALIRWQHPTRGLLSPGVFLPAAKGAGLLAELSTVVLAEAARDVARWNRRRTEAGLPELIVHVNCVEEQLMDSGFADVVGSYLAATGLAPRCLLLEISEETALDRLPASLPTLDLLRSGGVRFSIDDFGFGNSSLTMIRRVGEVAELKIDKSIVDGLALSSPVAADVAVITSIVEFCGTQGITVVAEGVEEEHQFIQLVGLGVELYQGYLFHRPQPADHLDALLLPRLSSAV